jgi:hypothetical protein
MNCYTARHVIHDVRSQKVQTGTWTVGLSLYNIYHIQKQGTSQAFIENASAMHSDWQFSVDILKVHEALLYNAKH